MRAGASLPTSPAPEKHDTLPDLCPCHSGEGVAAAVTQPEGKQNFYFFEIFKAAGLGWPDLSWWAFFFFLLDVFCGVSHL